MTESKSTSPLVTLWYKPGPTLQGLIAEGKGGSAAVLFAVLFGLVQAWPMFVARGPAGFGVLLLGGAAGALGLFFFSWLLRNFSRWFGSKAELVDVRTALGWGMLPWALVFGLTALLINRVERGPEQIYMIAFIGILYGFVILLFALSSAMRLSFIKTFLCLIVTFLVSIFPITLVLQLVMGPPPVSP